MHVSLTTRQSFRASDAGDLVAAIARSEGRENEYRDHQTRGLRELDSGHDGLQNRLWLSSADFRDAIALARTMRAKAFELRAATRLARILRQISWTRYFGVGRKSKYGTTSFEAVPCALRISLMPVRPDRTWRWSIEPGST